MLCTKLHTVPGEVGTMTLPEATDLLEFWKGEGKEEEPVKLSTPEEMMALAAQMNGGR